MKALLNRTWNLCRLGSDIFDQQRNGIVLLTLVPFLISGTFFAMLNGELSASFEGSTPQIFKPTAALALTVLTGTLLLKQRTIHFVGPLMAAVTLLAMALKQADLLDRIKINWFANVGWSYLYGIYFVTVCLSVIQIARGPTMSTWLFRAIALLLILDVILSVLFSGWSVLHPLFLAYFPSQFGVLIGLMTLMLVRMVVKFITENAETKKRMSEVDPVFMRSVWWTSFRLWWPMLAIFAVCLLGYGYLNDRLINRPLIEHLDNFEARTDPHPVVFEGGAPLSATAPQSETVEAASTALTTRMIAKQTEAINARIDATMDGSQNTIDSIMGAADTSLPHRFPGTHTRRCGFLDIICYIENGIKSMINSAYASARANMLADLKAELQQQKKNGEDIQANAKAEVLTRAAELERQSHRRIRDTATGLRYAGWATLAYSILILAKSFMIVFARVFYAKVSTTPARPDDAAPRSRAQPGRMATLGSQHKLAPGDGYWRYFISFKACGNNVVDRRRIPQSMALVLKRLWSRNYMMCLVDFKADKAIKSCDLIVDPPAEIVQWDLKKNDEVFVDMGAVIGFSDSCQLRGCISLSLGALIFGRVFYHSIQGPGRLYIKTRSAPLAAGKPGTNNIMQASSLVAWRRDTEFNVVSSLTVGDTFLSGYSIRKADRRQHMVIYDTSQTRRVSASGGILRMARAFLIPF